MREYILKSTGLEEHVYKQVLAIVRGYETMKKEYDGILESSPPPPDGQPRSGKTGDTTSRDAVRRADISQKIEAVEKAIEIVPEEYRQGVWDSAVNRKPYPRDADRVTYWRYKSIFYRTVAKKMFWI